MPDSPTAPDAPRTLARTELVLMTAALMGINALSIDMMLPALPEIGRSLHVAHANDRQLVIVVYVMASGFAQLIYGPLADALGRRRVLLGSLAGYLIGTALCVVAGAFPLLLAARVVQGLSTAATRVVAIALVRDLVSGPRMAQIMSLAMTTFMIVPIIAPGLGQIILLFAPWRTIFGVLLIAAAAMLAWSYRRVPETLPPPARTPLNLRATLRAYADVITNRTTLGYTLAQTLMFCCLFSFLTSSQQVFAEIYALGPWFPLAFASTAVTLSAAQFTNARLVMRLGMRRLTHGAVLSFTALALFHALHAHFAGETLAVFMGFLLPTMFVYGFIASNANAIAMEPMGRVAGVAAAFAGFLTTVGGSAVGGYVGHVYDGTIQPMLVAHAALGASAVAVFWITERGRLFRREHVDDPIS